MTGKLHFVALLLWLVGAGVPASAAEDDVEAEGPVIELPEQLDPSQDTRQQRVERAAPTSIGSYGEIVFSAFEGDQDAKIDFHRFVLFVGHQFNDWISFFSEVEVEHAKQIEMEQAFVDLSFLNDFTIRAGLVLVPLGLTNIYHEPVLFNGALRPLVDRVIVPTTWREAGLGLIWTPHEMVTVEGFVLSGLDAAGFSSTGGIRGGRQSVSKALSNDPAGAVRVTVEPVLGFSIGLSGYAGAAGQDQFGGLTVPVGIVEADARYYGYGIEFRAEAAVIFIGDTLELSRALEDTIGERLVGWYLEAGYDVLHPLDTTHQIVPFARYEVFNTQASVVDGLTADPSLDRSDITVGLSYRPISTIVFKADYQITRAAEGHVPNQWNLGFGWMF